jgi:hypothetical protein
MILEIFLKQYFILVIQKNIQDIKVINSHDCRK